MRFVPVAITVVTAVLSGPSLGSGVVSAAFSFSSTTAVPSCSSGKSHGGAFGVGSCSRRPRTFLAAAKSDVEEVSICVVGGGVSGLAAAVTAAKESPQDSTTVVLLEKADTVGGRVRSVATDDGYTLDVGFAVFIEEYPASKLLLDYAQLDLGKFVPGSLVKTNDAEAVLHKVADPLRVPSDLLVALLAPVGTLFDKVRVLPLLFKVFTTSIEDLFAEDEMDTLTLLKTKYGFSDVFIRQFFQPFLEGIYLAPLEEQSSRMFHFVFKMFSEGSATLPRGGMGRVADLLASDAEAANVDIRTNTALSSLSFDDDGYITITSTTNTTIKAKSVILATDGGVAQDILSSNHVLTEQAPPRQTQRRVGCVYYGFPVDQLPVSDPILILNGVSDRTPRTHPVNNICFPSVVAPGYAPEGYALCSVTLLGPTLEAWEKEEDDPASGGIDQAIRQQLATWFPACRDNILNPEIWKRQGPMFVIDNAQPAQLNGPTPANVHGGRDATRFRDTPLPKGLLLCGDYMATATLNGALESGVKAGKEAVSCL